MLTAIIIILAISFVLYTILGGADFGAGIVEIFAGKRGERIVSKAIAPVWEANHVWLILAIVIIFTGFPTAYSIISTSLHIPLMAALIGIIIRGSFFTFRYYDADPDSSHKMFSFLFKASSLITPVFLGVILGAMMLGDIIPTGEGNFYEVYIKPWFNPFCLAMGLFSSALFGYIASVFLLAEVNSDEQKKRYSRLCKNFLLITMLLGLLVFVTAEFMRHRLFTEFLNSTLSMLCFVVVIALVPYLLRLFVNPRTVLLRVIVGIQVAMIMLGWFSIQFPVLIYDRDGNHLSFFNAAAPEATQLQLLIALVVGLIFVVPAFYFLFRIFKASDTT